MRRLAPILVAVLLVAAGCDDDSAAPTTTTTTTTTLAPTAEELLADTAVTMETVDTLRYDIQLTGAPVTLLGVEMRGAQGQYAAPASSQAVLQAAIGGLTIELGTIAIGETSWLTNPLSGEWDEYTGSRAFNPAIIFDPELGWRPLLTTDITEPRLLESTDEVFRVAGTTAPGRVEVLTAGLVDAQPVDLVLEIDRATGVVTRMDFATQGEEGETMWALQLSDFGSEVSISPPEVD